MGVVGTSDHRFDPGAAAPPAATDLCPVPYSTTFASLIAPPPRDGRCTNDAYTAGIDTVLRTSDGAWGASAQVIGSLVEYGPIRIVPDGTQIGSGATGLGAMAEVGRYGGEHWLYRLGYAAASPRLQINDAGFLGEANYQEGFASLTWRTTRASRHLLSASVEAYFAMRRDWRLDDILYNDPHVAATLELSSFWTLYAQVAPYFSRSVLTRETQDGARTERGAGSFATFTVKTDPRRLLALELTGTLLAIRDGETAWDASARISLRPIPALDLDLIPTASWSRNAHRWIATQVNGDDSRTYLFGDLDARSFDVTLRGTYAFRRTLSLQVYVQPFLASGHYTRPTAATVSGARPLLALDAFTPATFPDGVAPDFRTGALNLNLFLRWEYMPLSALWLVYTRNQQQTPYDPIEGPGRIRIDQFARGPATDVVLLKLSYLWF
jgi:hypothetical protein